MRLFLTECGYESGESGDFRAIPDDATDNDCESAELDNHSACRQHGAASCSAGSSISRPVPRDDEPVQRGVGCRQDQDGNPGHHAQQVHDGGRGKDVDSVRDTRDELFPRGSPSQEHERSDVPS